MGPAEASVSMDVKRLYSVLSLLCSYDTAGVPVLCGIVGYVVT
jgi:hypothetical protein